MNGNPSLTGPLAKLDRARAHKKALHDAIDAWADSVPYTIVSEMNNDSGWYEMRLRELQPPPISLGLIFGDMVNNLRSALDHLVWQLVRISNGQPTAGHGFPIVKLPEKWEKAAQSRLAGVREDILRSIRAVQPFHDGPNAPEHPLAVLDNINNVNKHRVISAVALGEVEFEPTLVFNRTSMGDETVAQQLWQPGEAHKLKDGAIVGRVRAFSPRGDFGIERIDPGGLHIMVGFDTGGGTVDNEETFAVVERIIAQFKPAFPS